MDAAKPKRCLNVDDVYTKGGLLCLRQGEWIWKYPLQHVFSICHKHGNHWGSKAHKVAEKLEPSKEES